MTRFGRIMCSGRLQEEEGLLVVTTGALWVLHVVFVLMMDASYVVFLLSLSLHCLSWFLSVSAHCARLAELGCSIERPPRLENGS